MAFTTSNPFMQPFRQQKKPKQPKSPLTTTRPIYGGLGQMGPNAGGGPRASQILSARAPSAPAAPSAPRSPADPRDAQYLSDVGNIEAGYQRQSADLTAEGKFDRLAHQRALALMAERHPEDLQDAREAANRRGLFYSGHLGKQLGDLERDYARRVTAEESEFGLRETQRANALDELERLYGTDGIQRLAAYQSAIERAMQRDQELGVPLDDLPPAAGAAVAAQAAPQSKPPTYDQTIFGASPIFRLSTPRNPPKRKKRPSYEQTIFGASPLF